MCAKNRNKDKKKVSEKVLAIDTTIIEHLACLEINNLILQSPFHLVSDIKWNDKGLSFDGTIDVYSHHEIKKSNFINKVPVQVKGTTIQKTLLLNKKISHSVKKEDLEVYYKHGQGVLYFVVTINPITHVRQAYYRILVPLELKSLLSQLDTSGNDSISLHFKLMEKGDLENLCRILLNEVKKQPQLFIDGSKDMEFTHYKLNFIDVKKESFNLFEETAFIYGILSDNTEIPLEAAKIGQLERSKTEQVDLNGNLIEITHQITNTEHNFKVVIENTLTFDLDKKKRSGNLHIGKVRTLGSYIKCLRLLNYYLEQNKLPIKSLPLKATLSNKKEFQWIEKEINSFEELLDVCSQIGISENYEFNDEEDLTSLFNAIIDIFKNKQYSLLNLHEGNLSEYVKLKVVYANENFINFYSEEAIKTIGGLKPKTDIAISYAQDNGIPIMLPEQWEEYYWKTSIYTYKKIEELTKDTNFDFGILKLSFDDEYYDIESYHTINTSLDYIKYFDKSGEEKYLQLALELNQRYSEKVPDDDYAKVNIYLINLKQQHELSEEEQAAVLDIQERAESDNDDSLRFACEVLLKNKPKSKKIFSSLSDEQKETIMEFPIYHFYQNL